MDQRVYSAGIRLLMVGLRLRVVREPMTWFAKVWLRHARIARHLRWAGYDAVIDGGAAIGEFAGLVRLALPRAKLLCVEPHPPSAAALRRRGFTVIEAALWREEGEASLVQPQAEATSCTLLATSEGARLSWRVRTVRLDGLGVRGDRVLVKLDLQGGEPMALDGMDGLWDRCAGLLLEVSYGDEGTYEPLRARLAERGFTEAATLHELETDAGVVEADKVFLRRGHLA